MSKSSGPISAVSVTARRISIRALLVSTLLTVLVLLLLITVLNYTFAARLTRALSVMEEETARASIALEVNKEAANVLAALAQGVVTNDAAYFTQIVKEAGQALSDAEGRLAESADALPPDDSLRIKLYGLATSSEDIYRLTILLPRRAEEGKWWEIEQFERSLIPYYGRLVTESADQVRAATVERRAIAVAEVGDIRYKMQVTPVAAGLLILVVAASAVFITIRSIARPVERLTDTVARLAAGRLEERVSVGGAAEFGHLATAFNEMADQLEISYTQLEHRVAERSRALERRAACLEAAAEVSRAAASILETDRLMQRAVELIRERFDMHYVGLFLVDEGNEWAVLRAGSGEAGRAMLARGHRLKVGEGMIGWSIANAEARIASKAETDTVRLVIPELAATRSEAALPLRSRGRVLGALSVQDDQPDAFDQDAITALQTMTDQIAVALDNAQLLVASQTALEAERRAYGEASRQAWVELLRARTDWGYDYEHKSVTPAYGDWDPEMQRVVQQGASVQEAASLSLDREGNGDGEHTLFIPLKVRDQVIGALSFCKGAAGADPTRSRGSDTDPGQTIKPWTADEVALLETLTEQLGVALESARLYQDTQRRAARERLTSEVTARMRETLDMDTVLRTATDEIYRALGLEKIIVRLATGEANDESALGDTTTTAQRGRTLQEEVV
ncbi:MAG: hypothetical protein DRI81_02120 [Chloroflexi bacterium]|nr:MAG: hypothetical protein DRI81_02120 [Chloroflexota bacterium]